MTLVIFSQIVLLAYHQITTGFDLHPFNGVRNYTRRNAGGLLCRRRIRGKRPR